MASGEKRIQAAIWLVYGHPRDYKWSSSATPPCVDLMLRIRLDARMPVGRYRMPYDGLFARGADKIYPRLSVVPATGRSTGLRRWFITRNGLAKKREKLSHSRYANDWAAPDFDDRNVLLTILVTLGTVFHNPVVLSLILRGLADLNVNILATVGPNGE